MSISREFVQGLFGNLEAGRQEEFFAHVADNVNWQVMGTHPLAGVYQTKQDFLTHTFSQLNKILKGGVVLRVHNIIIAGSTAVVELSQLSTGLNGKPFHNTYCWIVNFDNDMIISVRAYLDSALVQQFILENTPH